MSAAHLMPAAEEGEISLAEAAYRRLRDKLIMLEIKPGAPINDGQLAAELGVGRTPSARPSSAWKSITWLSPTPAGERSPPSLT